MHGLIYSPNDTHHFKGKLPKKERARHTYGRQEMGKDPRITMIKMIFSGTPKLLDE